MKKWYRYLLYGVICTAVVLAGWMGWQRHLREAANKELAVVIDYDQVVQLASRENLPVRDVLQEFAQIGVTGVLFKEQNMVDSPSVYRSIWTATGNELLTNPVFAGDWAEIKPNYTYFLTRSGEEFDRLAANLEIKLKGVQKLSEPAAGLYLVGVPLLPGMIKDVGIGFPSEGLKLVSDMGLSILPQIRTWPGADATDISQVFSQFQGYNNIAAVLFNDGQLPPHTEVMAKEIDKIGAPLAGIEFFPQQGFNKLAMLMDKNVVRLHAISAGEMAKTTPREAVDRFLLAATDRNNRILFARFFFNPNSPDWLGANKQYLTQVVDVLQQEGFVLGQPSTFPPIINSRVILFIIGLGGIAGGMLLLDVMGYRRWGIAAGILLVLLYALLLASGHVSLGRKLFALGGTVVFPTLAMIIFIREKPRNIMESIFALIGTAALSLIGAVLMVGLLADKSFMLKLDQFMGVKAAFAGPPVLIFIYLAFLRYRREDWVPRIKAVLESYISVKYLLLVGVLGLVGLVYIMRSGNEGVFVSDLELRVRSLLEQILVVRPRTKEFLIGHPLLFLTFYLGYKDYLLPVVVLASIGQVSLVNTFAHSWTPLAISLFRTFNGLWLGILGGIALVLLYRLWLWLEARYLRG
ncbi:DUF5693 family protein [Metallumcola ferriviriculae]|uniref:DUF5693 family protein n=1 Tax=Metallumcola ferriviriculae TaxID=3039180 RepID=A0AAU0UL27_9FIRM|nr:DUF5693 family protein [Desulfitibacteraceae bacterium MK1]